MKKRLGRKLLSLVIAGMLFMNLPINVQAADEITVDFSQFTGDNWWLDSAGNYGSGAVLEEGCEWYGPLKLNAMFGRTMIDKKDLHAAING